MTALRSVLRAVDRFGFVAITGIGYSVTVVALLYPLVWLMTAAITVHPVLVLAVVSVYGLGIRAALYRFLFLPRLRALESAPVPA